MDIRSVLGTVPVEEDGSAHFTVPANTPIALQPLDENGAAAQAGLQKEDVITSFGGKPIASVADLRTQLLECRAGQQIPVTVFRGGEYVSVTLTTGVKTPQGSRTGYANVYDL